MISYAGIGSRNTPEDICKIMRCLGSALAIKKATLRSGAARGADTSFEQGCDRVGGNKIIFTANNWYESSSVYDSRCRLSYDHKLWSKAIALTMAHHPAWFHLSAYEQKLHTRNCFQVLGVDLESPAKFVLCWTPDGATTTEECSRLTGGTGQAIRVASTHKVPVYNLAREEHLQIALSWLKVKAQPSC